MNPGNGPASEPAGMVRGTSVAGWMVLVSALCLAVWLGRRPETERGEAAAGEKPGAAVPTQVHEAAAGFDRMPVGERWREMVREVPERPPFGAVTYRLVKGRHRLDSMSDGRDSRFAARLWAAAFGLGAAQEGLLARRIQGEREDAFAAFADHAKTTEVDGQRISIISAHELRRHIDPERFIGELEEKLPDWLKEDQWDAPEFRMGRDRAADWLEECGIKDAALFQLDEAQREEMRGKPLEEAVRTLRKEQLLMLWWTSPQTAALLAGTEQRED